MKRIHAVETVEHTHWCHDRTWSIRIYGDAIFTELHSWNAMNHGTPIETVEHLPVDCVNPRTANLLAQYAVLPGRPKRSLASQKITMAAMG
jgi:hypothetical protein